MRNSDGKTEYMLIGGALLVLAAFIGGGIGAWTQSNGLLRLCGFAFIMGVGMLVLDGVADLVDRGQIGLTSIGKWIVLVGVGIAVFAASAASTSATVVGTGVFVCGAVFMSAGALVTELAKHRK